jgi:nitric oxide reductase NorE protein
VTADASVARELPDFLSDRTPRRTPAPPPAPPASGRRIPGEAGLWVFLLGDLTLFGVFFIAFVVTMSAQPELWATSATALHDWPGMTNTVVLLTASFLVARAVSTRGAPRVRARRGLLLGAAGLGVLFVLVKAGEYAALAAAGITPGTNLFFTYYFVLTGIHLAHVAIGIVVLVVCATRLPSATPSFVEGSASYWHMVDLLWIILFPLLYLVGRLA